jgi:hypothetical protein
MELAGSCRSAIDADLPDSTRIGHIWCPELLATSCRSRGPL